MIVSILQVAVHLKNPGCMIHNITHINSIRVIIVKISMCFEEYLIVTNFFLSTAYVRD